MSNRCRFVLLVIGIIFFSVNAAQSILAQHEGNNITIIPERTASPIKIDGNLDEDIWQKTPLSPQFVSYLPSYGQKLLLKTEFWMSYDSNNLYFAFKCYDTVSKIKTSLSPRDKIGLDDNVAVLLDAMGNKQTSYEFYVNPSGIQLDGLYSTSGADYAKDFVWHSAAKITAEGYQVEMAIPLESIRFQGGENVKMGLLLLRDVKYLGLSVAWPETEPGQTDFNFMATVKIKDLQAKAKFEVLPNFTYSRDSVRTNADSWSHSNTNNLGVLLQYGITSSILAEATINPDFSQVESDMFQVEVNQRYPIFYDEKRPFFMEGMGAFDFGLVSGGVIDRAVHTRNIIDPSWAAKVTGSAGKMSFAVLAANDQSAGQGWLSGVNPHEGKDVFWGIMGGKYNIGSDNSLGFLYSGRHFAGSHNNVVGLDLQYRFFKDIRLNASYLSSSTKESAADTLKTGSGINVMLQYLKPTFATILSYERYNENFLMYSAFQNRSNLSMGTLLVLKDLFSTKKESFFQRIQSAFQYFKLHDLGTGMDDTSLSLALNTWFLGNAFFRVEYRDENEAWMGQLYEPRYLTSFFRMQMFKWLQFRVDFRYGGQIYYGPGLPFLGNGAQYSLRLKFQPDIKLTVDLNYLHNTLNTKNDGQRFYTLDILNFQANYQFNKYFFIRGTVRYDDYKKKLLTDILASFTLIPGTVMHLGYGSLYERKEWLNDRWVPGQSGLTNMKNGLFFKVSYLWKINK